MAVDYSTLKKGGFMRQPKIRIGILFANNFSGLFMTL